jgi:hypothetical protein
VNLPSLGAGIAVTPIGANKQTFNQVRGRLSRKAEGKASARLYVIWDQLVFPRHLDNFISWNPTVTVRDRGKWVDAREYRKRMKKRR